MNRINAHLFQGPLYDDSIHHLLMMLY